jgi:hypothetical protein
MTVAPGARTEKGPVEGVLTGEADERAVKSLLRTIMTESGLADLRSVLEGRLGGESARRERQRALRSALPSENALFGSLIDTLSLKNTFEVASEMTRILGAAVERGTSDELMRRAIAVVLGAIEVAVGPDRERPEAGPASRVPSVQEARTQPVRSATQTARASTAAALPGYDPHGPFRIPDRVVRFGELDELLAAPFFPASGGASGAGPIRTPSALPPPPETDDPDLIRGWLRGLPAFADSIAVRAGLLDFGDPGDLMEIEAEFHTDPKAALRLYKAVTPVRDGTADAAWCARLGRDIGRFGVTHEGGVEVLASQLRALIGQGPADRYAPLARSGAVLVVREELAEAVCGLIDAEAEFLEDGPADTSGPDQNLLGSFSPSCDLSRGRCLERALGLHLVAGQSMGSAMRQSLTEFRIAQALRENPEAPISFINDRFDLDAALPLSELCGREPIVRIGLTMPALA